MAEEIHVAMTPFELTEQAKAQESATEALAEEMMRIRRDVASIFSKLEEFMAMSGHAILELSDNYQELGKAHNVSNRNVMLLKQSVKDLAIVMQEIDVLKSTKRS